MTATLRQVAEALKERLDTIDGLRTYSHIPGHPQMPAAILGIPRVTYEGLALSSDDVLPWPVIVLVSTQQDRKQLALLDYQEAAGPRSIPAAIQSDPSLGLDGVHAFVAGSDAIAMEDLAGYNAFGVQFDVMVRIT